MTDDDIHCAKYKKQRSREREREPPLENCTKGCVIHKEAALGNSCVIKQSNKLKTPQASAPPDSTTDDIEVESKQDMISRLIC